MAEMIVIKLKKSLIGRKPEQRATVRSLGLRKISSSVVQEATPSIIGMIDAVKHLVEVRPYAPGQEQKK
jgi:large subunit ribosomal protein L30